MTKRKRQWVVVCNGSRPDEFRKWAHASKKAAEKRQKELDVDLAPCGPHSVSRLTQDLRKTE